MTVFITGCRTIRANIITLNLLDFIFTTFFNEFAFIVNQGGAGFANAHLTTTLKAILVVPSTVVTFSLWGLVKTTLQNGLANTIDSGVAVLTDTSGIAAMAETTTSQIAVLPTWEMGLLITWTFFLATSIEP